MMHFDSMYSAVRIIGDVHPKLTRSERGVIGTGFLISVRSEMHHNISYPHLVTAAHVIENQRKVEAELPVPRPSGGMYPAEVVDGWRRPLKNVDLAVSLFRNDGQERYIHAIPETGMLPNANVKHPTLAGPVAYVGILTPQDRPMVRTGTIGAIDQENLDLDGDYDYPAYLIDCRSYGGFSGSPVFAGIPRPRLIQTAEFEGTPLGEMVYFNFLCGMFTEHLTDRGEFASSRYGVGVAVRSIEIREALMSEELRRERHAKDERERDTPGGPAFEKASAHGDESEFERFEDLTKKLVNTPKTDAAKQEGEGAA